MKEDFNRTFLNTEGCTSYASIILDLTFPKANFNETEQIVRYKLGGKSKKISFYDLFLNITSYGIPIKTKELRVLLKSRSKT
jgi:hypothetical protein